MRIRKSWCALVPLLWAVACSSAETGKTAYPVEITVSGESLVLDGYAFPPATADDIAFLDGWEVTFRKALVTVDRVVLSDNPDVNPGDQSQAGGVVAELDGPFAIDLHKGGPLLGKGGGDERALSLGTIANQNKSGGAAFDSTRRYAFGFDVVVANSGAKRINIDEDDVDYAEMIAKGYSSLFIGRATFKGTRCESASDYDFTKLPRVVHFRFGFQSPTTYVNCQNPSNEGKPIDGEESQRGVQVPTNAKAIAQVTIHTDHLFWDSLQHDSPAHFDQYAAIARPLDSESAEVTLEDVVGANFTAFRDRSGTPLGSRSCLSKAPAAKTLSFDSLAIPYEPSSSPDRGFRDYRDYVTYAQSTFGHLNADGLCAIKRNYPSPL